MRFQSKYSSYKIWLTPSRYQLDSVGNRVFVQGKFAQFEHGFYQTSDEETIKLLKQHPSFGIDFWSIEEKSVPNEEGKRQQEIMQLKKEELVTDCPVCGKSLKNRRALLAHVRAAHSDVEIV